MFAVTAAPALVSVPLALLAGWLCFCAGSVLLGAMAVASSHVYREAAGDQQAAA
jgi:hypothetical protein